MEGQSLQYIKSKLKEYMTKSFGGKPNLEIGVKLNVTWSLNVKNAISNLKQKHLQDIKKCSMKLSQINVNNVISSLHLKYNLTDIK